MFDSYLAARLRSKALSGVLTMREATPNTEQLLASLEWARAMPRSAVLVGGTAIALHALTIGDEVPRRVNDMDFMADKATLDDIHARGRQLFGELFSPVYVGEILFSHLRLDPADIPDEHRDRRVSRDFLPIDVIPARALLGPDDNFVEELEDNTVEIEGFTVAKLGLLHRLNSRRLKRLLKPRKDVFDLAILNQLKLRDASSPAIN